VAPLMILAGLSALNPTIARNAALKLYLMKVKP
jgi:hypothetical protein